MEQLEKFILLISLIFHICLEFPVYFRDSFSLTLLKHIPFGEPKPANYNSNPAPNIHDNHHFPFSACSLKSVITEVFFFFFWASLCVMRHYEVFSFADWVTKTYLLYCHCAQWTLFPSKPFSPLFHIPKPGLPGPSHWAFSPISWFTLANGRQQWETEWGGGQVMCSVVPASSPWAVLATVLAVALIWKPPCNEVLVS